MRGVLTDKTVRLFNLDTTSYVMADLVSHSYTFVEHNNFMNFYVRLVVRAMCIIIIIAVAGVCLHICRHVQTTNLLSELRQLKEHSHLCWQLTSCPSIKL